MNPATLPMNPTFTKQTHRRTWLKSASVLTVGAVAAQLAPTSGNAAVPAAVIGLITDPKTRALIGRYKKYLCTFIKTLLAGSASAVTKIDEVTDMIFGVDFDFPKTKGKNPYGARFVPRFDRILAQSGETNVKNTVMSMTDYMRLLLSGDRPPWHESTGAGDFNEAEMHYVLNMEPYERTPQLEGHPIIQAQRRTELSKDAADLLKGQLKKFFQIDSDDIATEMANWDPVLKRLVAAPGNPAAERKAITFINRANPALSLVWVENDKAVNPKVPAKFLTKLIETTYDPSRLLA